MSVKRETFLSLRRHGGAEKFRQRLRASIGPSILLCIVAVTLRGEVRIERTILPYDVAPSSFAIGLPGGVNFCFDPVRGGVSYAWTGEFLDIGPVRPGVGKNITAAKPLGPIVYREAGGSPLRRGDPARVPLVEFKGYTLRADSVEFRYTVDGALVREEIRARADGHGLVERFDVAGAADAGWWYVIPGQPPRELGAAGKRERVLEIAFEAEAMK